MKVYVVAVGNRMPAWVDAACGEYLKRMPVELIEIKPIKRHPRISDREILAGEEQRINAAVPKDCQRVVLDERGESWSTEKFAQRLASWKERGISVAFIIGGADGLASSLKAGAETLSLSALTLPHTLARVVLLEQIYRAFSILDNHPYHRG